MNCEEAKKYIMLIEDGEIDSYDTDILNHIKHCPNCKYFKDNLIKTKKLLSANEYYSYDYINKNLDSLNKKIFLDKNKIDNIRYNNFIKNNKKIPLTICAIIILLVILPFKGKSIAKAAIESWENKLKTTWESSIELKNNNYKLSEGTYTIAFATEYPNLYKCLQERQLLIDKALKSKDKKSAYREIDKIVEQYDDILRKEEKKDYSVSGDVKKYKNLDKLKNEIKYPIPSPKLPNNYKFNYALHSNSNTSESIIMKYFSTNDSDRINSIRKDLTFSYISKDKNDSSVGTTFPQGTKFKKINIKNHEAYIIISFEKNSDIAFISLTIPMGNHDIGLTTTSTKNKLDKDELMLINIANSF